MTTRRNLLIGAGAAALTGVAGGGFGYAIGTPAAAPAPAAATTPKYSSRPDFQNIADVTITTPASGTAPGYLLFSPASGSSLWGPLMVDQAGSPVWFRQTPPPATVSIDFKVQQYRKQPVLTWWEGTIGGTGGQGVGQGEFVIADRSYREITRVRAAGTEQADQHDLIITPQDTALFWVYDPKAYDLTSIGGPKDGVLHDGVLQEIDIATGRKLFEWRSSDHVGVDESYAPLPQGDSAHLPYDYFHANSVGLAADGDLIISARHTWAVYKIDRRTGAVRWRLGGKKSDIAVDERTSFAWQHDFRQRRDGSWSVFDNGAGVTKVRDYSRGVVFTVDEDAKTTAFVAEYLHPDKISAPTQGNFRELADGGSFIGWGQMPHFTEHDADGSVRLAGHIPLDNQSYRAYKAEWTAEPLDRPALGLRPDGGNVIVSASWNGATKVASWRARWGTQPDVLTGGTIEAPRSGFETTLTVPGTPEYVVAEALDDKGTLLGVSSAVPVRV
ncbi:arylsulfotransferase family protein [Paractinoplanes atraurantiacus]|uniref:Arylsulfotransferase (ASST) n=1 Tax=Paractinoplanes atraurantiacus TaxID=1036182 RepID=A0A285JDL4_9ACTN|nr:arylsulfotransferase family protein [Actinoplanes atraurantiacus]SNY58352.1 Arylsulfotransferase (ASST) [Actinoplanes atraurantiacus]